MNSVIAAVLAASLGGSPTFSVAVTRRVGLDAKSALTLAELFGRSLERSKANPLGTLVTPQAFATRLTTKGLSDPTECAGAVDCATVLAQAVGVDRLVAVQMARVGTDVLFDVTVVDAHDGASLATASEQVPAKKPTRALDRLAATLAPKIPAFKESAPPPPPPPPAPVSEGNGTPPPTTIAVTSPPPPSPTVDTPTATTVEKEATPPARYVAYGLGGLGLVAAGVGVAFGLSALTQADACPCNPSDPAYATKRTQAFAAARTADYAYGGAAICLAGAVVLWVLTRQDASAAHIAASEAPAPAFVLHF